MNNPTMPGGDAVAPSDQRAVLQGIVAAINAGQGDAVAKMFGGGQPAPAKQPAPADGWTDYGNGIRARRIG